MSLTTHPSRTLVYNGSVKQIYRDTQSPGTVLFAFTDDYSVFDWGKMPDTLANKGLSLVLMGGYFFDQLSQPELWQALPKRLAQHPRLHGPWLDELWSSPTYKDLMQHGIAHHSQGLVNDVGQSVSIDTLTTQPTVPVYLAVNEVQVTSPQLSDNETYNYQPLRQAHADCPDRYHLVPLEVVFRLGIPEGSSYLERDTIAVANNWLQQPVVEFFTKLEPHDRWLSPEVARTISGLSEAKMTELTTLTLLLALWLSDFFEQRGIALWDGKFEFAYCPASQQFMLVDSIGPDELRLMVGELPLSKECLRQFYRTTPWYTEWTTAKARGEHAHEAVSQPPHLPVNFKTVMDYLYPCLLNTCVGRPVITGTPELAELVALLGKPAPFAV